MLVYDSPFIGAVLIGISVSPDTQILDPNTAPFEASTSRSFVFSLYVSSHYKNYTYTMLTVPDDARPLRAMWPKYFRKGRL